MSFGGVITASLQDPSAQLLHFRDDCDGDGNERANDIHNKEFLCMLFENKNFCEFCGNCHNRTLAMLWKFVFLRAAAAVAFGSWQWLVEGWHCNLHLQLLIW